MRPILARLKPEKLTTVHADSSSLSCPLYAILTKPRVLKTFPPPPPFPASLAGLQLGTRGRGQSRYPKAGAMLGSRLAAPRPGANGNRRLKATRLSPAPPPLPLPGLGVRPGSAQAYPSILEGRVPAARQGPLRRGPGMRDVSSSCRSAIPAAPGLLQRAPAARPAPLRINGEGGNETKQQSRGRTPR